MSTWRLHASLDQSPSRALQQWLVFAAVDSGAIPTPRERDAAKVHGCPVCRRPMVGWGHHGKGVCSVACHEAIRNRVVTA